jgi:hypothetical protein
MNHLLKYSRKNKKAILILNCECGIYLAFKGGKQIARGKDFRKDLRTRIEIYE